MSDSEPRDQRENIPDLPDQWILYLADERLRVQARRGELGDGRVETPLGSDLADHLADLGLDLADVGEMLVCLEEMPDECELRLHLGSESGFSVVARRLGSASDLTCVVLRPRWSAHAEPLLKRALDWAEAEAAALGFIAIERQVIPQILVVDSNPEVVEFARSLARKLGCRSAGASSAGEALARVKNCAFDLILVDAAIPGLGAEALSSLLCERSNRHWGRVPSVAVMGGCLVAAQVDGASPARALSLEKPFGICEMRHLLAACRSRPAAAKHPQRLNLGETLEVLHLELWHDEPDLLARLAQALVSQGLEFLANLTQGEAYVGSDSFFKEVRSLKNGSDIVHAQRLSAACSAVLQSSFLGGIMPRGQAAMDTLLVEIEGFRIFATDRGLLRRRD